MTLANNVEEVICDIQKIKDNLSTNLKKIGLFGSSINNNFEDSNDIDIVLFVDNITIEAARDILPKLNLNYPVKANFINGGYTSITSLPENNSKHYHIVLLNSENPNNSFLKINEGKMIYV